MKSNARGESGPLPATSSSRFEKHLYASPPVVFLRAPLASAVGHGALRHEISRPANHHRRSDQPAHPLVPLLRLRRRRRRRKACWSYSIQTTIRTVVRRVVAAAFSRQFPQVALRTIIHRWFAGLVFHQLTSCNDRVASATRAHTDSLRAVHISTPEHESGTSRTDGGNLATAFVSEVSPWPLLATGREKGRQLVGDKALCACS